MKKLLILMPFLFLVACMQKTDKKEEPAVDLSDIKVPVYAWMGGPRDATDEEIKENFTDLKNKGIIGLMYNGGHDPETYKRVGGIAKEVGLEFHTWIPTMLQRNNSKLDPDQAPALCP